MTLARRCRQSQLSDIYSADIPGAAKPPCLSLYQPTHRPHPHRAQDPIRFRNLVKSLDWG